jgi:hypothetical protein
MKDFPVRWPQISRTSTKPPAVGASSLDQKEAGRNAFGKGRERA